MPISVKCPGCQAALRVPDGLAGKKVKCPKCQGIIAVTAAPPPPPPEPVAEAPRIEPEPAAAAAPAKRPITRRARPVVQKKSSAGLIVGIAVGVLILGGGAFAGWWFFLSAPVPDLLDEVPPGNFVLFAKKGTLDKDIVEGATEAATCTTEKGYVTLSKGSFDVAKLEAEYTKKGFSKKTVDGYELLVSEGFLLQAVHLDKARVLIGSQDLVLECLRIRAGKAKSFKDNLTSDDKSMIRKLPSTSDFFLYMRPDKNSFLGSIQDTDFECAVSSGKKVSDKEVEFTMHARFKSEDGARKAEGEIKDDPELKVLSKSRSGRFVTWKARGKILGS